MTTKKKGSSSAGTHAKKTPDEMAKAIHSKDAEVRDAVHTVLRKAGLHGVTVHSVQFSVAPEMMTSSGCFPPCDLTKERCVSIGGSWKCVPLPQ